MNGMIVYEIKDRDIRDDSTHYRMSSKKGDVEFSVDDKNKEMIAYMWNTPEEGKRFLGELENFASMMELQLTISNVINPKLETILRKAGYSDYYIRDEYADDTMQCWRKNKIKKEK